MASFAVLVFLLMAGVNFGTQPEGEFYDTTIAMENAIAGSAAQKKTPETVRCPDGVRRSQCVDHKWHGCSDDIGC
jgi:hypothetical protein